MNTKTIFLAALASLASLCAGAELRSDFKKDKFGYVDDDGVVVIRHQYQQALPFEGGMAKVKKGDKWGYINEANKAVIPIKFDEIGPFFEEGFALVRIGANYGYIRRDGTYMIKPEWKAIGTPNKEGYVWVARSAELEYGAKGLYKYDRQILKPKYTCFGFYQKTDTTDYSDGHPFSMWQASEMTRNKSTLSTSELPYIWTVTGGVYHNSGICDLNGVELVPNKGKALGAPRDGMALTRSYSSSKKTYTFNYFILGQKGKKLFSKDVVVTADDRQGLYAFNNGVAVNIIDNQGYLINPRGTRVSQVYDFLSPWGDNLFMCKLGDKFGVLGPDGKAVTECKYADIMRPKENQIMGAKDADTGKWGMIDGSGREVIPFIYEGAAGFMKGRYYIKDSNGWGILSADRKVICAPQWSSISFAKNADDRYVWVQRVDGGKWQCLDMTIDRLVFHDLRLDEAAFFDPNGQATVVIDKKHGLVNDKGQVVIPAMFADYASLTQAREYLKSIGKPIMDNTEAYRYSLKWHPDIHKQTLSSTIDSTLWDY